ncbi:hypothetical protein JKP88DRAFT_243689 [Tribonema minus]|uniref:Uncharacterized protein n=1 Tax=Tribonema minus TaxID=303371 RepID=A0A836CJR1_9STRA|nr:hypothetical protein JKP88DRAFT_243689 [Tribonema minus]
MMNRLALAMLAAVAVGVHGSDFGDPTIVAGAPPPTFGAIATDGFGTGYVSSSGQFTFQNVGRPSVSGFYMYHTALKTSTSNPFPRPQLDGGSSHCVRRASAAAAGSCDPSAPGAYNALFVSTGANAELTAAFITQPTCERGSFSYAADGTTLLWSFALVDPDFATTCQALPSEPFSVTLGAERIARVPDAAPSATFCGFNFYP